jgi:hypothetical protein
MIGRRNISGYIVDGSYVDKKQKKQAAAIVHEDKTKF